MTVDVFRDRGIQFVRITAALSSLRSSKDQEIASVPVPKDPLYISCNLLPVSAPSFSYLLDKANRKHGIARYLWSKTLLSIGCSVVIPMMNNWGANGHWEISPRKHHRRRWGVSSVKFLSILTSSATHLRPSPLSSSAPHPSAIRPLFHMPLIRAGTKSIRFTKKKVHFFHRIRLASFDKIDKKSWRC